MFRLPRQLPRRIPPRSILNLESLEDRCLLAVEPLSLADLNLIAATAGGQSQNAVTSADGRFVAYQSTATNLIANQNDTNLGADIFLFDRVLGTTTLVSHAAGAPETAGNGASFDPQISGDGQFIVFSTLATNLNASVTDTNAVSDVYLFDRLTGAATLVSGSGGTATTASGTSTGAVISRDGNFIAFVSDATNVVFGQSDINDGNDVFLYQRSNGFTRLVSSSNTSNLTTGNGIADSPSINSNGDFVAFRSDATDHAVGQNDQNNASDVFLFSRTAPVVPNIVVSRSQSVAATTANAASFDPVIGNDGNFVAFVSLATNTVVGQADTNGEADVFVFDRVNVSNALVSHVVGSGVTAPTSGASGAPAISGDGNFIVYASDATAIDLVGGADINNASDVFLYNRTTTVNTLVSRNNTAATTTANGASDSPVISNDNAFIAFRSTATNIFTGQTDTNNAPDIFLYQRSNGNRSLVSRNQATSSAAGNGASSDPAISADGRYVAFASASTNLQAAITDTNGFTDVFLYDRQTLANNTLSLRNAGLPSDTAGGDSVVSSTIDLTSDRTTSGRTTSADGRYVVFVSTATNLAPNQIDINFTTDVFLRDRFAGTTTLVSHLPGSLNTVANAASFAPVISLDGQWVAFLSEATNLVSGQNDGNGGTDVFLFNRLDGSVTLVSGVTGSPTTTANTPSAGPILSGNGNLVVFTSAATDLVTGQNDSNSADDVFAFDRTTGTIRLVSGVNSSTTTTANAASDDPSVSDDGSLIAFRSDATNVVGGVLDTNNASDVFLFNRTTASTSLVSHSATSATTPANNASDTPRLSADGSTVAFSSLATNLVAGQFDANGVRDVFLFDRATGTRVLVSHAAGSATATANGASTVPSTSADGGFIAFSSLATNLVPGQVDNNNDSDVFLFARQGGSITLVSHAAVDPSTTANAASTGPRISANGTTVAFRSDAINLVTGQTENNGGSDVFAFNRLDGVVTLASQSLASPTATANSPTTRFDVNGDGGLVVFNTFGNNLVPNDRNSGEDVFAFLFNRAPIDITLDDSSVPGNLPPGQLVGNFTTNDPDTLDTFTYQLVPGPGDSGNASFVIMGSELRTNASFDPTVTPALSIRVRVTDSGGLTFEKVFIITIGPDFPPDTVGMFDPFSGTWYLRNDNSAGPANVGTFTYGLPNWDPVVGDWDGNGDDTIGVVDRTGVSNPDFAVWYLRNANNPGPPDIGPFVFGLRGWVPVVGDWDGDGVDGIGMFDPSTGIWYLRNSPSAGLPDFSPFFYGLPNWTPIAGDWDGDGRDSIGVIDPSLSVWYLRNEVSPGLPDFVPFPYGLGFWKPVVGDWDGDGTFTPGVVDTAGNWYLRNSNSPGAPDVSPFPYGLGFWTPVAGGYIRRQVVTQKSLFASTLGDGTDVGGLDPAALGGVVTAALPRLAAEGIDPATLDQLAAAQVLVADLPGTLLGLADTATGRVWIDSDAAGWGWFVDQTPGEDGEFAAGEVAGMDLLSAVAHELGHLAEWEDLQGDGHADDLMGATLQPGQRRVHTLDALFSNGL